MRKEKGVFMDPIFEKLKAITKEENIRVKESMANHTTFRTGGVADYYVTPETVEELEKILQLDRPVTILGNGSNVLVTDLGIRGIVVSLKKMNHYTIENNSILAESGVAVARLSQEAAKNSLSGLEFACGIPGTLGGAVYMNAGAYGGEMKDVVVSTVYLDRATMQIKTCENHEFVYRGSIFSNQLDGIILRVQLQLKPGDKEEIFAKMKENMQSRNTKQPVNLPSAGSTFKRKEGVIAAKLIDEAGLKGYRIGGAEVSTLHAGFVVNTGNATSQDILDLIAYIQKVVNEKYQVTLDPEVKILGERIENSK